MPSVIDLTSGLSSIINTWIDSKLSPNERILPILNKYFLVTITSYKYIFDSKVSETGIDSVLKINKSSSNSVYKFYNFNIPEISFKYDIENPFEDFSEQFSKLLTFSSVLPQLKNIQLSLYRHYLFPNINFGISSDSGSINFSLEFNTRFTSINTIQEFLTSLLLESQVIESSKSVNNMSIIQSSLSSPISDISNLNSRIKQILDYLQTGVDTVIEINTNIKSLRLQDYIYDIQVGSLFRIPQCGLTRISYSYRGVILYTSAKTTKYIPEIVTVNLDFTPIYPLQINNSQVTNVGEVENDKSTKLSNVSTFVLNI